MISPVFKLSSPNLRWMLLSLTLVSAPHWFRLPVWIPVLFIILSLWRYRIETTQSQLPPEWLRILLALAVFSGILFTYRTVFGRDAGVALLTALLGLKLLEMRTLRDALLLLFLGYFLIITNFLYSQSIPNALFMFAVLLIITATLISLNDKTGSLVSHHRLRLRLASALLIQAIPVMLALFLFFPRIEGQLWGLPKDAHGKVSGLSEHMTLDSINRLSLSDEVAFRVRFDGPPPPAHLLYWRGPVLWWTDGQTWKPTGRTLYNTEPPELKGEPLDYTVTLEAHNQDRLFALDLPEAAPNTPASRLTPDYQLTTRKPVNRRVIYKMRSYLTYDTGLLNWDENDLGLLLPNGRHPRARALAAQWRTQHKEDKALVEKALQYFNREKFFYTLEPPPLQGDTIDAFLFQTRRGFCEHYAAAFTVLMRAAGIPTRVVTGYQGGELNPFGNYLIVRQRDAHAWSEVWLEESGWTRVDPTSAVAPSRVQQGISSLLGDDVYALGINFSAQTLLGRSLRHLENHWDMINMQWNEWVLGYGGEHQYGLLAKLGISNPNYKTLVLFLFGTLIFIFTCIVLWLWWQEHRSTNDPVQCAYRRFCAKLARLNIVRSPHEGPMAFAERAARLHPKAGKRIKTITRLYTRIRYRNSDSPSEIKAFTGAVRRFRPHADYFINKH